ncbi:MAG TPA: hypothetical protein VK447_03465 [Myxococcaceae bacterium]|nr:hypothetical protein [Myxococcaceae bacterium]
MADHDIHTLEEFQQAAREHIQRLKASRGTAVVTVDGKPEFVVQSLDAHQELLDRLDLAEAVAGIQRGLESMRRDEGVAAAEAFEQLRSRLGVGASVG